MARLTHYEARGMVTCLTGCPYSAASREFVRAVLKAPDTASGAAIRTIICCEVFHSVERILAGAVDPIPRFIVALQRAADLLRSLSSKPCAWRGEGCVRAGTLEAQTGSHYGTLFSRFDAPHYYDEAFRLLASRFTRNGFKPALARGLRALDAGCGGGRYTVALKRFGFQQVVGVDFSEPGIRDARARLHKSRLKGISFRNGSVLSMPFPDASFDFVFSNGVLHHTKDMSRGVHELLRVLKSGGRGFVYVIENPGGIFWDVIEILRVLMKPVPYEVAQRQFELIGVPANRTFYILDHIMVPINIRSTPEQVESLLRAAGATDLVRLARGADFDRVERIYRGEPFARVKFGVGENRYLFSKP